MLQFDQGDHEIGSNSKVEPIAGLCAGSAKPDRVADPRRTAAVSAESTSPQTREVFYESADDLC